MTFFNKIIIILKYIIKFKFYNKLVSKHKNYQNNKDNKYLHFKYKIYFKNLFLFDNSTQFNG